MCLSDKVCVCVLFSSIESIKCDIDPICVIRFNPIMIITIIFIALFYALASIRCEVWHWITVSGVYSSCRRGSKRQAAHHRLAYRGTSFLCMNNSLWRRNLFHLLSAAMRQEQFDQTNNRAHWNTPAIGAIVFPCCREGSGARRAAHCIINYALIRPQMDSHVSQCFRS